MTNQVQGEIIFAGWTGSDPEDFAYTPWVPVGGDVGTFAVEVTLIAGGLTVTWGVQTRKVNDPAVTNLFSGETISSVTTGVKTNTTPAQELVRYRFSTGSADVAKYALVRALTPSWNYDR